MTIYCKISREIARLVAETEPEDSRILNLICDGKSDMEIGITAAGRKEVCRKYLYLVPAAADILLKEDKDVFKKAIVQPKKPKKKAKVKKVK